MRIYHHQKAHGPSKINSIENMQIAKRISRAVCAHFAHEMAGEIRIGVVSCGEMWMHKFVQSFVLAKR